MKSQKACEIDSQKMNFLALDARAVRENRSFLVAFIGVFAGSVVIVVAQVELQGLQAGLKLVRSFPGKPRPFERARGSGTWPWRVATALPAT